MARRSKKNPDQPRKKKALWKRILKWTGITFLALLLIAIALPFIFKGKIVRMVKEEMNSQLNAVVDFDEDNVELTFISTFPVFTLTLHDVTVDGVGVFEEVRLADIGSFSASLDLESVIFGDQIEVKRIALEDADIHVKVLEDGTANYDIAKPDTTAEDEPEEESNFRLALDEYSITNANLIYDDRSAVTYIEMNGFDHSGSGDITADVFKLETHTTADKLTFGYDGVNYLSEVNTEMDADFDIDMTGDMKIAFHDNKVRLNNLNLSYDGEFVMGDDFYDMTFDFGAEKAGFKEFLSLIPAMYASDFAGMTIIGDLGFSGSVKGKYSDTSMPGFDISFSVTNGYVKYADLPDAISNINIASRVSRTEALDLDNTVIDVKRFHADLGGNSVDAVLNVVNPMTDPGIQCVLKANLDLASVGRFYPMGEDELTGRMKADVELGGRMSAIDNEQYEKFKAQGSIVAAGMKYVTGGEEVNLDTMVFNFSPQNLTLAAFRARAQGTSVSASGVIDNYLGNFFRNELLKGEFDVHADQFNADAFLAADEGTAAEPAPEETAPAGDVAMEPFIVPSNIDFTLRTGLDQLTYNGIPITNVKGVIVAREGVANLQDLTMNVFGGTVGLKGAYDSRTPEPKVDFSYAIREVNIADLSKSFVTVQKLAPIASKCTGKISSDFTLTGALGPDMMPLYSSLTGGGDLSSKSIYIEGFEPLNKLAQELKLDRLARQTINDVKLFFEFADGKVSVKPHTVKLANKVPATISGYTSFEEVVDYDIDLKIPKSEVPAPMIEAAEKAMGQANKIGLNLGELPAEIPVHADITGTVKDPKVSTNFREQLLALTGNLTDAIKDQIKEKIDEKVEEVKEKVEDKVEEVKEDLKAKAEQIMKDAQAKADQVKAEGKKLADKTRAEGEKQAQDLEAAAKNPLEKQGAKIAAKKVRDEANKKADQVESESQKKADAIMAEARKKVDELEKQ